MCKALQHLLQGGRRAFTVAYGNDRAPKCELFYQHFIKYDITKIGVLRVFRNNKMNWTLSAASSKLVNAARRKHRTYVRPTRIDQQRTYSAIAGRTDQGCAEPTIMLARTKWPGSRWPWIPRPPVALPGACPPKLAPPRNPPRPGPRSACRWPASGRACSA